ncbi:MAG: nitroreductase/quinone reductase family protein, partial [Blastocatellia bacterium]
MIMEESVAERLKRVAGSKTVRLTHYGRKSGKPYQVTIWFAVDVDRVYLGTAKVDRQWVRNVQKTHRVVLAIRGEIFDGEARFLRDRDELDHAQGMIRRKYWPFLPVMVLARLLAGIGLVRDTSGFFEVTFFASLSPNRGSGQ